MRVAVVGAGPVGVASAVTAALGGHDVLVVEQRGDRRACLAEGLLPFHEEALERAWKALGPSVALRASLRDGGGPADLVVCCVGTPSLSDGSSDLSQVERVAAEVAELPPTVLVVRSTVPPGTGARLAAQLATTGHGYAAHPEFLQEGRALQDSVHPSRIVVGADDAWVHERVFALYPGLGSPRMAVDIPTAELIKVAANAHLAMRISFINEMAVVAEHFGADIEVVAKGLGLDPRIGPSFLRAGLGYGGSCFPKDVRGLTALSRAVGSELRLLRAVIEVNVQQPVRLVDHLVAGLGSLRERRVAIWGVAFKPGTDDVRESQAVRVAELLLERGARVVVHDPVVRAPGGLPARVDWADGALAALDGADALVLATEWPEYRAVEPGIAVPRMAGVHPLVMDGRNALRAEQWIRAGAEYHGMGRGQRASAPSLRVGV